MNIKRNTQDIKEGDWISLCENRTFTYVIKIINNKLLSIGYQQNDSSIIKENIIWDKNKKCWKFEKDGPCGISIKDLKLKQIIKKGPFE